ncbi:hypothetical protein CMV_023046, partial [Castanea mollissima]
MLTQLPNINTELRKLLETKKELKGKEKKRWSHRRRQRLESPESSAELGAARLGLGIGGGRSPQQRWRLGFAAVGEALGFAVAGDGWASRRLAAVVVVGLRGSGCRRL